MHRQICRVHMHSWLWTCKRLVKANLARCLPIMQWGRLGLRWVWWGCSKSVLPFFVLFAHFCRWANVSVGGKKNSNYFSNYLIISLRGGEQEGGWRCLSVFPFIFSWWHLKLLPLCPVPLLWFLVTLSSIYSHFCHLQFSWPPTQTFNTSWILALLALHVCPESAKKVRRKGSAGVWCHIWKC